MLSVYILLWLSIDIYRYKPKKTWQTHATCSGARMRRRTLPTFPTVFCNEFLPCSSSVSCQCISIVTGWWLTYPSEKYESPLGLLFPIYGKIKHVPNISKPPTKYQLSMWTSNGIYMDTARVFNPGLGPGWKHPAWHDSNCRHTRRPAMEFEHWTSGSHAWPMTYWATQASQIYPQHARLVPPIRVKKTGNCTKVLPHWVLSRNWNKQMQNRLHTYRALCSNLGISVMPK
jgi:hypothetical protein